MDRRLRSSVMTGQKLQDALIEMLREMPFERITVSALTRRAGINRTTFYLLYGSIHELLETTWREMVEKALQGLEPDMFTGKGREWFIRWFASLMERIQTVRLFFGIPGFNPYESIHLVFHAMIESHMPDCRGEEDENRKRVAARVYESLVLAIIRLWLERDGKTTPEDAWRIGNLCVEKGLIALVEN